MGRAAFFGSGVSHLLKMITHLWVNTTFEDGATARSLVRGGLPDEVDCAAASRVGHPRKASRRQAGRVAAAGSMLGGIARPGSRDGASPILLQATGCAVAAARRRCSASGLRKSVPSGEDPPLR